MFEWSDDMSKAPKDGTTILICSRGMRSPWQAYWKNGKFKQGWYNSYGFVTFSPEFWMLVECPQ